MTKNKKDICNLRTGVIGTGSMGSNHARVYSEISNLVAVADSDERQGRLVAKKFGAKWYSDYHDMLDEVDAVTVSVPTAMHREISETVASFGVNMLIEKPLAGNTVDAEAIVSAAKSAGIVLAVGHIERHSTIIESAKELIDANEWGSVLTLSARRFSNYPSRIHDVGVLFDLTIHDVDVICYLTNSNVKTVYAYGGRARNEHHEDHVILVMGFEDGRIGICETNWLTPMKVRNLSITTTACYINLDYLTQSIEVFSSEYREIDELNLYQPIQEVSKHEISLRDQEPLKKELEDFLDAVIKKRMPLVTGREGVQAVRIVEAGLKSLKSKSVINI